MSETSSVSYWVLGLGKHIEQWSSSCVTWFSCNQRTLCSFSMGKLIHHWRPDWDTIPWMYGTQWPELLRHHSRSVTRARVLFKSDNILKSSNQTASNSYWWLLPRSRKEGLDKGHELFGPNQGHLFNYELRIQHPVGCSRVCDWVLFGWVERMCLFRKWVKF